MAILRKFQVEIGPDSFRRRDEAGSSAFLAGFDSSAGFETVGPPAVRPVLRSLVDAERPAVLHLMAGTATPLGPGVEPSRVVGVGPGVAAMQRNPLLTERLCRDLDREPSLPFADATFDVILLAGAFPYLTRPLELVAEASRVLTPGGVMLVIFDARFEADFAVRLWRRSTPEERLALVDFCLRSGGGFGRAQARVSRLEDPGGTVRPVLAVFAVRSDRPAFEAPAAVSTAAVEHRFDAAELAARRARVGATLRCPYCDRPLSETEIPDTPFNEWDTDRLWVCFAADCPFTRRSVGVMGSQGNLGVAYRVAYHRGRDHLYTVADTSFADRG